MANRPIIKIGAGKGKLLGVTNQYLEYLGLETIDPKSRVLTHYREADNYILKITLLRWEDIKAYANSFDMIIFGSDQWLENGKKSMIALKHFEQKDCRLSLLVPKSEADQPLRYFLERKIATGYPELAKSYMGVNENNIVKMTGSVEAAIGLDWAQSIFDIVESGATARENGLVEYKTFVRFGAVLATCKPEKIPVLRDLGLVGGSVERKIIAFDGVDGSGKSSLAKHFVQEGLGDSNPIVLMCPYSGYVGTTARSLLDNDKYMEWAMLVGENHWRPTPGVNMVYDRSVLTSLTELIKHNAFRGQMLDAVKAFSPLPQVIFWCNADIKTLTHRTEYRGVKDKYDTKDSLKEYSKLYKEAVDFVKSEFNIKVIELDTSKPIEETIKEIKEALKCIDWER